MRSSSRRSLRSIAIPLAVLLAAGCSSTFTPASVVEDLRVLAIVAEPPEVRPPAAPGDPNETVTLRAVAVAPPATPGGPARAPAAADVAWSFCPFSIGASSGYACAVPSCETALLPVNGSFTVDPIARSLACLAALGGALPGAPAGSGLPQQIEVLVRYQATLDGVAREAVQRIPVWTTAPPATVERNLNPVIADVTTGADCTAAAGSCAVGSVPITVSIDPASFQPYPAGDRTAVETVVVSFFTTAGRFKDERGQATAGAPQTSVLLEAKELGGAREALVWVVARDLRGGEAVRGPLTVVFSSP
jgi:hypothetical protein